VADDIEARMSAASRAASNDLGLVPFATCDMRSQDPFNSIDEANGIFNWADEDEDRSADADAPVKNPLRASQAALYVKNDGSKRSHYVGLHHVVRDGKLAHSQIGALKAAMQLATGKFDKDIPAEHRSAVRSHINQELSVFTDGGDSDEASDEDERMKRRLEFLNAV
jgi:hypothetical protein